MLKNKEDFIMGINSRKINNDSSTYAQIIRNERLRRHMTLEDASKDICSVSYLCKLENSTIRTNETFVRSLCERFCIDYDVIDKAEIENIVQEAIKFVFLKKDNEVEDLYKKIENLPFNSRTQIVKCFYLLQRADYQTFKEEVKYLDNIKYTLTDIESVTLIYLVVLYYIGIHNYNEAYKYLKLSDMIKVNNKFLKYLLLEANILVSYNINNYCRLINSYIQYERIDITGYPLGRKLVAKMINNAFMCEEYPSEVLDDINNLDMQIVPCDSKLDIIYYMMIIKIKNGHLSELFREMIDKSYYFDARFMGLLAYIAYMVNKKSLYKELLSLLETYVFEDVDAIHQKFVYFIVLYATSKNKDDVIKYLKEHINPHIETEINPIYNRIYKKIYLEHTVNASKYKESYYFLANHPRW